MDQEIWQWTLTKEAIAPCFVRDVLEMRKHTNGDVDFFWLGHIPCRTVLLVGMVVGIQVHDKRAIYTIDDGTAVIDCALRHPHPTLPAPRSPPRCTGAQSAKPNAQRHSPKKPRLDKTKLESTEPPPPITEPGYPVRVIGRVARHYESKQIHADTIDPCPSSLDEIAHLERVIELHKTKYSLAVPFVPPPKVTSRVPPPDTSTLRAPAATDSSIFCTTSPSGTAAISYTLPQPPPPTPRPVQSRPPSISTHLQSANHGHAHVPSSPTASSIASSTPSSPCKPSSPIESHEEAPRKPKLRHPSRLHTRELTGNTFRLYIKHYMDNAPPPFPSELSSLFKGTCGGFTTPTKRARDMDGWDDPTPRPRSSARDDGDQDEDGPTLGFTLSHLRRVPELALLAARVVRAETRKRDKEEREKCRSNSHSRIASSSSALARNAETDPARKKMKRLFSWAVVKLYQEGSVVLWDGDVRPLPLSPLPVLADQSGLWKGDDTRSPCADSSVSCTRSYASSTGVDASVLYTSSASASLYSHYHPPRRPVKRGGAEAEIDVDADADPGCVSDPDPGIDEEAYVPLTPQLLAGYVREAVGALRRGRGGGVRGTGGTRPTPEDILAYLRRTDGRWARVGVWAVEEALGVLKAG